MVLRRARRGSHAAPGHHFADRNELLAELATDGYSGLADALAAAMEGTPPDQWMAKSGSAYVRYGLANPERYRMMFASRLIAEDCPERFTTESSRAYLMLLKAAYGREPDIDPATYRMDTAELAGWSMVHGAMMLWLDGQLGLEMTEAEFGDLSDRIIAFHFGQPG